MSGYNPEHVFEQINYHLFSSTVALPRRTLKSYRDIPINSSPSVSAFFRTTVPESVPETVKAGISPVR